MFMCVSLSFSLSLSLFFCSTQVPPFVNVVKHMAKMATALGGGAAAASGIAPGGDPNEREKQLRASLAEYETAVDVQAQKAGCPAREWKREKINKVTKAAGADSDTGTTTDSATDSDTDISAHDSDTDAATDGTDVEKEVENGGHVSSFLAVSDARKTHEAVLTADKKTMKTTTMTTMTTMKKKTMTKGCDDEPFGKGCVLGEGGRKKGTHGDKTTHYGQGMRFKMTRSEMEMHEDNDVGATALATAMQVCESVRAA